MHLTLALAQLPLAGKLLWLIEFPPAWSWFLTWAPGMIPPQFVDHAIWPLPSPLSSASCGLSRFGPQQSGSTLTTTPCVQPAALPLLSRIPKQEDCQALEEFLQEATDLPLQQPTLVQAFTQSLKPEEGN